VTASPRRPYDWLSFRGYSGPAYTQIPDELLDHHLAHLTGAEVKVLLYIARRTFGWKKDCDAISFNQMLTGIRRRDGTKSDEGAGVSRSTLVVALDGLEQKGLITRRRFDKGTQEASIYAIRMAGEPSAEIELGRPETNAASAEIELGPASSETGPAASTEIEPTKDSTQKTREPKGSLSSARERKSRVRSWDEPDVQEVWTAWVSTLPEGVQRIPMENRLRIIAGALARFPVADCVDAVRGWRWDDWKRRKQNNDLEDCLRQANLERFRDWERGIERPVSMSSHSNASLPDRQAQALANAEAAFRRAAELKAEGR
jgi:hypothetical protein